jgi:transcriptional regulator with XRE-family HTH domain
VRGDIDPDALRVARIRARLTQHDLAVKLGLSGGALVSKWERGSHAPRADLMWPLARALGVDIVELLPAGAVGTPSLRDVRVAAGLSAKRLSEVTRIPVSTLAEWESGRGARQLSEASAVLLAEALGVDANAVHRAFRQSLARHDSAATR